MSPATLLSCWFVLLLCSLTMLLLSRAATLEALRSCLMTSPSSSYFLESSR